MTDQMIGLLPNLRAFALSLTNNPIRADDLVQDTFLRAWASRTYFQPGTNLGAWMFKIMRNSLYTAHRKLSREVQNPNGSFAAHLAAPPGQEAAVALTEVAHALARLSGAHREALLLMSLDGMSYEEVALVQGIAVGTVKSRVHRAREQLAKLLQIEDWHRIGHDWVMEAALQVRTDPSL